VADIQKQLPYIPRIYHQFYIGITTSGNDGLQDSSASSSQDDNGDDDDDEKY